MKNIFFFLFLLCILQISCSPVSRSIDLAEEIVMNNPDSAFALLRDIPIESVHAPWTKARLSLQKTIAENRMGVWINDDSLVLNAYHYYRRFGKKENRMKTLYYKGLVEHNKGDYINACQSLLQAEQLSLEVQDNHYLGLIYRHLSEIFSQNFDYLRAYSYAQKAYSAFQSGEEKRYTDHLQFYLAGLDLAQHRWEKAEDKIDSLLADKTIDPFLFSDALRVKAEAALYQGKYDTASRAYLEMQERDVTFLSRDYFGLAMVKEAAKQSACADSILNKLQCGIISPLDSATFYDNKHSVYDLRGDIPAAYGALVEALKIQNRVVRQQLEQSVSYSMATAFQSQYELERTRRRLTRTVWLCFGLILIFCVLGLWILLRRKNRQLLEEMTMVEGIETDLEILRTRNKETAAVLDSFVSDKIRSLQNIAETYFNWEDDSLRRREEKYGRMTPNEMLGSFRRELGVVRKDKAFIHALESSLNLSYDNIMDHLRESFPRWDEEDFTLLTLFFSGFSVKSIGFFMRMSDPAVRMRKTRFKQAFEALPEEQSRRYLERLGY